MALGRVYTSAKAIDVAKLLLWNKTPGNTSSHVEYGGTPTEP